MLLCCLMGRLLQNLYNYPNGDHAACYNERCCSSTVACRRRRRCRVHIKSHRSKVAFELEPCLLGPAIDCCKASMLNSAYKYLECRGCQAVCETSSKWWGYASRRPWQLECCNAVVLLRESACIICCWKYCARRNRYRAGMFELCSWCIYLC